ncbi:ribonuclease P protein component [Kwoniella newhampshirensis]|uniref:Ribonuclease P protein component n=1 Tax=Kwoniella newhampshirensis TaxID=1651941 RepID=A0AAW0YYN2_9TREE
MLAARLLSGCRNAIANSTAQRPICSTCHLLSHPLPKSGQSSSSSQLRMICSTARSHVHKNTGGDVKDERRPIRKAVSRSQGRTQSEAGVKGSGKPFVRSGRMSILDGYGRRPKIAIQDESGAANASLGTASFNGESTAGQGSRSRSRSSGIAWSKSGGSDLVVLTGHASDPAQQRDMVRSSSLSTMEVGILHGIEAKGDEVESSAVVDQQKKTMFIGIDLESSLSKIFLTKLPLYRSPLFTLRAFPSHLLPPRRPPPFPLDFANAYREKNDCVYLAVIGSKSQVSKLAVERNRARRRFRAAIEQVVVQEEKGLVVPHYAYVASLTAEIHDAKYETIANDIKEGLRYLRQTRPRRQGGWVLPSPRFLPRGEAVIDESA